MSQNWIKENKPVKKTLIFSFLIQIHFIEHLETSSKEVITFSKPFNSKSWTSTCTKLKSGVELTHRARSRATIIIWNWAFNIFYVTKSFWQEI